MSSSGSDSGDEDYIPSDGGSQPPSEVESDGDEEDSDICDGEGAVKNAGQQGKRKVGKRGKVNDDLSKPPRGKEEDSGDTKQKSESLWSDFLKDVSSDGGSCKGDVVSEKTQVKVEKKTVSQVYDFAGEKVTIFKEVEEESLTEIRTISKGSAGNSDISSAGESSFFKEEKVKDFNESKEKPMVDYVPKQSSVLGVSDKNHTIAKAHIRAGASSLSSALNKLGKKNKLSTLEKSKLDWESYKNKEGISEEISAHNRGKSGYLDKRDFLEQTDLKQYELEKQMRNSIRRKL